MTKESRDRPSLEKLVESGDLGLEIIHPGGLEVTQKLAELCAVGKETKVLEVAAGTGESACYLAETFGCPIVGIDHSLAMVERARKKAQERRLKIEFTESDAHNLRFNDNSFDVVIAECTICLLNKKVSLRLCPSYYPQVFPQWRVTT